MAKDGLVTIVVSEHPDVRLLIDTAGYRRRAVSLLDLLQSGPPGRVRKVELERGLLCQVEVYARPADGSESTAIAGAEVWDGSRRLGVTDVDGRMTLDLWRWPEGALRAEARGYQPSSWYPADFFGDPGPMVIEMEPVD